MRSTASSRRPNGASARTVRTDHVGALRDDEVAAHTLDVLPRCALAANHVNESFDICAFGLPAFEDIVGDRDNHDPTFIAGQAVEKVWPSFRPRGSA